MGDSLLKNCIPWFSVDFFWCSINSIYGNAENCIYLLEEKRMNWSFCQLLFVQKFQLLKFLMDFDGYLKVPKIFPSFFIIFGVSVIIHPLSLAALQSPSIALIVWWAESLQVKRLWQVIIQRVLGSIRRTALHTNKSRVYNFVYINVRTSTLI